MYLALKEIMHNKLRYSLVVATTFLIAYMVFFMTSLALGLVRDNRSGIDNLDTNNIVLSEYANENLTASFIPEKDYKNHLSDNNAMLGYTPAVLNKDGEEKKINVSIFSQDWNSFIAPKLIEGNYPSKNNEVVVDKSLENNNVKIGSKIILNGSKENFTVVGITENNKFLTSAIVFTSIEDYWNIKGTANGSRAISALIMKDSTEINADGLQTLTKEAVIKKIPGYAAQNSVFSGMIGALVVITSLVIGIFIYIITIQKLSLYGIMRAQGIKVSTIVSALFYQICILSSVGIGLLAAWGTKFILPKTLFYEINWIAYFGLAIAMIVVSLLGGLISLPKVLKVSPLKAISE